MLLQGKLQFMHSIEYEYAPPSYSNVWSKNVNRQQNYNLRNNDLYNLPQIRLELFKKNTIILFAVGME
jgi:hypothetical protein